MSTPDPRTEAAIKLLCEIHGWTEGDFAYFGDAPLHAKQVALITDALTTEAARHVGKWSTARPTRDGWYWWRNPQAKYEEDREPTIYKVRLYGGELAISNCHIKDSHFERGEWCPIARPGEEG